jgi:hypothetical protein
MKNVRSFFLWHKIQNLKYLNKIKQEFLPKMVRISTNLSIRFFWCCPVYQLLHLLYCFILVKITEILTFLNKTSGSYFQQNFLKPNTFHIRFSGIKIWQFIRRCFSKQFCVKKWRKKLALHIINGAGTDQNGQTWSGLVFEVWSIFFLEIYELLQNFNYVLTYLVNLENKFYEDPIPFLSAAAMVRLRIVDGQKCLLNEVFWRQQRFKKLLGTLMMKVIV